MKIYRIYAQPSKNTFDILPINKLINKYWDRDLISIDPFAGNQKCATYLNDLNPETTAEYHMDVIDFLKLLQMKRAMLFKV